MQKKIYTIIGARPQFIKAAVLSRAFQEHANIQEIIIHSGQHHDKLMSDIFFSELNIDKPKYNLQIHSGKHGEMTGRMLEAIENILLSENATAVLVYGDTNTTLAGALAAAKLHIPLIHIEAGLRSFNKNMPEEINRVLVDHISDVLFCPTNVAIANLANEGITKGVHYTRDVMYDATLFALNLFQNEPKYKLGLEKKFHFIKQNFALLTIHRAESTETITVFNTIMEYVITIAMNEKLKVIFLLHPRTKKLFAEYLGTLPDNIQLLEPISYLEMQFVLSKAKLVLTDSGGLQKEAYFHKVPCITLRSETEWVETIATGWNRLWHVSNYKARINVTDEYAGGASVQKMVDIINEL